MNLFYPTLLSVTCKHFLSNHRGSHNLSAEDSLTLGCAVVVFDKLTCSFVSASDFPNGNVNNFKVIIFIGEAFN